MHRKLIAAALLATGLGCVPAVAQSAKPNDAQIAHIAYTAGQIDIDAAQLALTKSKNKEVRAFAEDMVRDHKAVNEKALALVKKLNVTPQDNDTSKGLLKHAKEKQAELQKLSGAASTRPTRRTRSPITRRSMARSRAASFHRPRMPSSRTCSAPGSRSSRGTSSTPTTFWRT